MRVGKCDCALQSSKKWFVSKRVYNESDRSTVNVARLLPRRILPWTGAIRELLKCVVIYSTIQFL